VEWVLEKVEKCKYFEKGFDSLEECLGEPDWWVATKYQQKASGEGIAARFLRFVKARNS
jgi:hypothetical protein